MHGCLRGWRRVGGTALLVLQATLLTGCGYKYKAESNDFSDTFRRGDFRTASRLATEARVGAEKSEPRNRLIWLLEEGSACRAAGQFEDSSRAFDQAEALFDEYDLKARVRVTREIYVAFTNPMALDYEGCAYERIMLNAYDALNEMALSHRDDARQAIHRIGDAQEKSERRYADKIATVQSAQRPEDSRVLQQAESDPNFRNGQAEFLRDFPDVRDEAPLPRLAHKKLYVNPFAEYLQGIYYLHSGESGDREVGRVAIRNAAGMMPENRYLVGDTAYAEQAAAGLSSPRTYVLFETGMAPYRKEIRIDIPVFVYNVAVHDTKVDYVGVAFPVLKKRHGAFPYLEVNTGERSYQTTTLADIDKIVAREFKDELPLLITRTIISAVAKAAMQYAVAKSVEKQDQMVQILARGITVAAQAALNETEVRCWQTLPKQVQLASFPSPAGGRLSLSLPGGVPAGMVELPQGKSCIVWVKSVGEGTAPQIQTIVLD